MQKFVDREEEMATLQSEYQRKGSALVILYGRRRVGKTTLISEFIKNKNALFFLASEESEIQNQKIFKEKAAEFISSDLLKHADVKNWDTIFKAIMDTHFESKPIIVLDEFQYIGKSNPSFPSVFQRIWEEILKDKDVMVILCGSLISMMESQTLDYSSPLYGRRTAQIRLKQIKFRDYGAFFQKKTQRELIELYAITGGVPKYIELFVDDTDLYTAIQNNILNTSSYLYDEPYFLLQQEISEIGTYFSIIKTIAAGKSKLSAIATALEIKQTSLTKYLKTLVNLDILEREVPITIDNPEKSKKGLYKIKDNYLRFWFAFIYPNRSFIESGNSQIVMNKIRQNLISGHIAYVYEDICREKMWALNGNGQWPFTFMKVGRWWDKNHEIDIVALDPNEGNIILGECKYWEHEVGVSVLRDLEKKADYVEWRKDRRQIWYILFSVSGFSNELEEIARSRTDVILWSEKNKVGFFN